MKIAAIIGVRPQFIKAAAISRAIAEHNEGQLPGGKTGATSRKNRGDSLFSLFGK
jgi:UDP-GlcNAc3NAcA epimerase